MVSTAHTYKKAAGRDGGEERAQNEDWLAVFNTFTGLSLLLLPGVLAMVGAWMGSLVSLWAPTLRKGDI